jgi:cytochrome bd-type quinol oxidase subunit 2
LTRETLGPLLSSERRARRKSRSLLPWIVRVGAALIVFAFGVALGQALNESPRSGETQTSVRTLVPETLPAQTVTVTVATP